MIGYIYKIYDNTNGNIYYGSTKESVSRRMSGHRAQYKRYIIEGKGSYTRSFDIFRNMDYSYSVVEKVEFNEKFELHQRERYYIENNECINKCIPNRTDNEYYNDNKDKINKYKKEWSEKNKDKLKDYKKEYYQNNKDKLKQQHKEYAKEYYKEKGKCPNCDKEMRKNSISRHIKKACKKI